jgi:hypothetical protein
MVEKAATWRCLAAAIVAAAVMLSAAWAQQAPSPLTPAGQGETPTVLLDRPSVPITPPTSAARVKAASAPLSDLPIVDRRCRLRQAPESGWAVLKFEDVPPQPSLGPHRVLPCQRLERMEQLIAGEAGAVFRVTGEVMIYQHQAYVLPRTISLETAGEKPQGSGFTPASTPPQAPSKPVADEPAASSSEGVLRELTRNRPAKPLLTPVPREESSSDTQSVAPTAEESAVSDRPGLMVDRLARAVRGADGEWWEVRFESDNTLRERPMRLLPCRLLEQAQKAPGRIVISGEITHYKGRAYLLLRKVLPERDMGQLQ